MAAVRIAGEADGLDRPERLHGAGRVTVGLAWGWGTLAVEHERKQHTMGTLLQVNVGQVQTFMIRGELTETAIVKTPVDGPVRLSDDLVDGDDQAENLHGGRDKAVYAYDQAAYDWWELRRGQTYPSGFFGENLTLAGVDVDGALLGERWRIGNVELEVRSPRIPCFKLDWRVQDRIVNDFLRSDRAGAYLRIVTPGEVQAGMEVEVVARPDHEVTVTDVLRLWRGEDVAAHVLTAGDHLVDDIRHRAEARRR